MQDTKEIWLPCKGYEGCYEISSFGNLSSVDRIRHTVLGKKRTPAFRKIKGKPKKQFLDIGGYFVAGMSDGNTVKTKKIHCLVADTFLPLIEDKLFVNHIDGNKQNNHIDNLEWCNRSENMQHAYKLGLVNNPKGEKAYNSVFSNSEAIFIYNTTLPVTYLADIFNVHVRTIYSVKQGVNYKTITT